MDLSWKTLLAMSQQHSPVCLGATYDTLPSPSNLHRWHINLEASCLLCRKQNFTTAHVLGACIVALQQAIKFVKAVAKLSEYTKVKL